MRREATINLFGTDGIRSKFGEFPLEPSAIKELGSAVSRFFKPRSVLIGRDTRESGEKIGLLLSEGFSAASIIKSAGIISTPGLSYQTEKDGYDIGIMITASHNPWFDNGIKIFNSSGEKITDEEEKGIENLFSSGIKGYGRRVDQKKLSSGDISGYGEFLTDTAMNSGSKDLKILLDCANGSAFKIAPEVFLKSGFDISLFNAEPDGKNINSECGSTFPEFLKKKMLSGKWDIGIAFDGDADRILMMDSSGREINGDLIIYTLAKYFNEIEEDFPETIVGTVMSNLALENGLNSLGFKFVRSNVGDRSVYKNMKEYGSFLGGEQSGHIIIRNLQKTGDGILTSIIFLRAIDYLNISPDNVVDLFKPFPQLIKNIKIKAKRDLRKWDGLKERIGRFNKNHGNNSRIIIRYSGTESKIRLMIESEDIEILNKNIEFFENYIISEIGD